jgi:hypothetical protein
MWKPMQKQITPRKHEIAWVEYIINPKLGFKLERAFQQITLYYQSCLTKVFPTLWYVQASTHTLQVFQEGDLKRALNENGHKKYIKHH